MTAERNVDWNDLLALADEIKANDGPGCKSLEAGWFNHQVGISRVIPIIELKPGA